MAPRDRKLVKRARYLAKDAFRKFREGTLPTRSDLITEDPIKIASHFHNTLSRSTNTTSEGGGLFTLPDYHLERKKKDQPRIDFLSIYARIEAGCESMLSDLLKETASYGFGADVSTGKGHFELLDGLERIEELDHLNTAPNGVVTLSTFQPAPKDPIDGFWERFTKYGKLGPDFGLANVFKRPLFLLRPGACFRSEEPRPYLGRAIPMDEILAPDAVDQLRGQDVEIIHPAFGLALPAAFPLWQ